jgi:hypothetical protein
MRISPDPLLPREGSASFIRLLLARLNDNFRSMANQVNNLTEGRIEAVTNAYTAAPTAGKHAQGDFVRNSTPTELGSASSKYVVIGWVCTVGGEPGTWVACRCLTGN